MACFIVFLIIFFPVLFVSIFWAKAIEKADAEWKKHKGEYKSELDYWGDMP